MIFNHSEKGDKMKKIISLIFLIITPCFYSQTDSTILKQIESLTKYNENLEHRIDVLEKNIDDVFDNYPLFLFPNRLNYSKTN